MASDQDTVWYYSIDEVSYGPVSRKELLGLIATGKLKQQSYVWRSGFGSNWRQIFEVPELDARVNLEGTYGTESRKTGDPVYSIPVTPDVLTVAPAAYRWTVKSLFRNFNILTWLAFGLAFWLANVGPSVLSIDARVIGESTKLSDSALGIVLICLKNTQNSFFNDTGIVTWVLSMLLFTLCQSFFMVRGRLMSLHFVHFPKDPLKSAWKRCKGITRSLVYFYTVLEVLEAGVVSISVWKLLNIIGTETLAKGSVSALWDGICSSSVSLTLFFVALFAFLVFELVKSLSYHFAEPIVYGRGVSILAAMRAVYRFCRFNLLSIIKFYLYLIAFNIVFMSVVVIFVLLLSYIMLLCGVNTPQLLASTFFSFMLTKEFVLLPVYYFVRTAGPKMLGVL